MTLATAIPWGRLVAVAALLLAGIVLGGWLAARHFEPQLAEANRKLGEYEHAYLTLAEATGRQNAAIDALEQAAATRKGKARKAAIQARGAAQPHYGRAEAILGLKPPPSADPCRAASADFDAELREERGRP
jgi:hypothetical protein